MRCMAEDVVGRAVMLSLMIICSVKMLTLSTEQIIIGDNITALPITSSAIQRMSQLALEDGRKHATQLVVSRKHSMNVS